MILVKRVWLLDFGGGFVVGFFCESFGCVSLVWGFVGCTSFGYAILVAGFWWGFVACLCEFGCVSLVREFWWCELVWFFLIVWFWLHEFGYAILVGFGFVSLAQGFGYVSLAREF